VLAFGTEQLKQQFVRRLLLDDVKMCLLYSEPGAGSDLAGLQTRADRDGDEWVVNGQKVWTSGGKEAEFGMLVARTNWDVPKHQGISFFWCPMDQPGVEVRPIRQITGEAHFNEVFLDDVRVPAHHLVGPLDGGWRVLQTALAYERSVMGDMARGPRSGQRPDGAAETADGADAPSQEIDVEFRQASSGPGAAEVDLWTLARERGRDDDPVIRQAIARVHELRMVNQWNGLRAKAQLEQRSSSPILSLGKLAMSRILHEGAHVQRLIVGPEALLYGRENPLGDDANFLSLNAFFTSIGGGTDQIQRNIIGERVLGLPREPEVDRDVPFSQVTKATVSRR
jgi:alkylation response protein AidB-like acyl-CoA dehydrogenase